ncbi:hypothetical protein WJX74_000657 [Apatococcus lobatus]
MLLALAEAQAALLRQEVPIGCVIVLDGTVIAKGSNRTNETRNATMHAELDAFEQLWASGSRRSSAEWARALRDICQGQSEVGGAASSKPHRFQAEGGMMAADAIALLQDFYASGNPNAPVPKRPLAAP